MYSLDICTYALLRSILIITNYYYLLFTIIIHFFIFGFFFQAEDGIRDYKVTGVPCALPISGRAYANFDYALNENHRLHWYGHRPEDYLTDVLAAKGVAFVDRVSSGRKPFFLELATFEIGRASCRGRA